MGVSPITQPVNPGAPADAKPVEQLRQVAERLQAQNAEIRHLVQPEETDIDLKKAFECLEKVADIFNRQFHFQMHEATKRYFVQIIDKSSGKVINEVPPEEILNLVAQIQELVGLLVDKKA